MDARADWLVVLMHTLVHLELCNAHARGGPEFCHQQRTDTLLQPVYLLRGMSMLDYLAEIGLFRAYNLTLTFLGAGTRSTSAAAKTPRSFSIPAPLNINVRL